MSYKQFIKRSNTINISSTSSIFQFKLLIVFWKIFLQSRMSFSWIWFQHVFHPKKISASHVMNYDGQWSRKFIAKLFCVFKIDCNHTLLWNENFLEKVHMLTFLRILKSTILIDDIWSKISTFFIKSWLSSVYTKYCIALWSRIKANYTTI